MQKINIKPEFYLITYHDSDHNYDCIDEDIFYDIDTLRLNLKYISSMSKVWAVFSTDEDTYYYVELCDLEKGKDV